MRYKNSKPNYKWLRTKIMNWRSFWQISRINNCNQTNNKIFLIYLIMCSLCTWQEWANHIWVYHKKGNPIAFNRLILMDKYFTNIIIIKFIISSKYKIETHVSLFICLLRLYFSWRLFTNGSCYFSRILENDENIRFILA